jgi:hypothetical protein
MIQRQNAMYGCSPDDNGDCVLYDDHLKEVELLKSKWIAGAPTKTGWHWIRFAPFSSCIYVEFVKSVDNGVIMLSNKTTHEPEQCKGIYQHCPIIEPVDVDAIQEP